MQCEGRPFYQVAAWTKNGSEINENYTTLREARVTLRKIRQMGNDLTDSYIRQYDKDGWCVRDYNE